MTSFTTCKPSTMDEATFVECFKDIYEHSAWVAQRTFAKINDGLTHADIDKIATLQGLFAQTMLAASQTEQLALINAHPDLAGKAAIAGALTDASNAEQADAGIHQCNAEEFQEFTELNSAYKKTFGFPFIKAVKGSNRFEILAAFRQRIHHSSEREFKQALLEINKISAFRLAGM